MSKITSNRLIYKQGRDTDDVWCVRIERRDGVIIRYTSSDINLTMSTRVDNDGVAGALPGSVTYQSASAYTPTATNSSVGSATNFDLEGILDAVSASGTPETHTTEYNIIRAGEINFTNDAANLIDGNPGTYIEFTSTDTSNYLSSNVENNIYLDLSYAATVTHIELTSNIIGGTIPSISVASSDTMTRWREHTSPVETLLNTDGDGTVTLILPSEIKSRFIRLRMGPDSTARAIRFSNIRVQRRITAQPDHPVSRDDIIKGLFDFARVYVFLTSASSPVEDDEKMLAGFFEEIALRDGRYVASVKSLLSSLDNARARFITIKCPAVFGDGACGVHVRVQPWKSEMYVKNKYLAADADRAAGTYVEPTMPNGYYYKATAAGVGGASEPAWPTTVGATVNDGSITWETIPAVSYSVALDTGATASQLTLTSSVATGLSDDAFASGYIEFSTGVMAGARAAIKSSSGTVINLKKPLPFIPSAGDTARLILGCRKRFTEDCEATHENNLNFRGFPDLPGIRAVRQFGGQDRL